MHLACTNCTGGRLIVHFGRNCAKSNLKFDFKSELYGIPVIHVFVTLMRGKRLRSRRSFLDYEARSRSSLEIGVRASACVVRILFRTSPVGWLTVKEVKVNGCNNFRRVLTLLDHCISESIR